ncbi:cyanophycinase [Metabacillus sp. GX 13764]|uniref:cyanophycinase n=1 Tax=Metabacillus kandeliae TaxID=2900151 RepID=UPI001E4897E7|nr:cyanophycinase [Metabacillus kandeliae]MCD7035147.1 cyanophycinase [Metabacillus kandeliae]
MKKIWFMLLAICLVFSYAEIPAAAETGKTVKGNLLVAGGGIEKSNQEVFNELIRLAGGEEKAKIGIVPAGSSTMAEPAELKKELESYGVKGEQIEILPISHHDFKDTKQNEAKWKKNVQQEVLASKINKLSAIWFAGDDVLQIRNALQQKDGTKSKALQAIWSIYQKGALVGGSAEVLGDKMIVQGDSLGALMGNKTPKGEGEPLHVTKGLGFFRYGLLDSHFDEESRLGRLTAAALHHNKSFFSYGIDEYTAVSVNDASKTMKIFGRGGMTVIDVSSASVKNSRIKNIKLHLFAPGDTVDFAAKKWTIRADKEGTKGYEYYSSKPLPATGGLTSYGRLKNYLAYSLMDNSSTDQVESALFTSKGDGFQLIFRKTADSNGYWGYKDGQKDDYSIVNAELEISPKKFLFKKNPTLFKDYKKSEFPLPDTHKEPLKGNLVITGGALGSSNKGIYQKFISLAKNGKIGIVPAASSSISSTKSFKADLIHYGVPEVNISVIPLSTHDLKGTPENEAEWAGNKNSDSVAKDIQSLSGIWFVGGDQTNITAALFNEDGSESKALKSMWDIYLNGAVLGGTSAGAAIMSPVMLAGGGSLDTLEKGFTNEYEGEQQQEGGPAYLEKGLGFFPYGMVDQHFDNKARLGRLIAAAYEKGNRNELAFGIDEDTALVINNKEHRAEAAGRGGITVLDLSKAVQPKGQPSVYRKILYSFIQAGDSVDLKTKKISIIKSKSLIKDRSSDNKPAPFSGVLTPHSLLSHYTFYSLFGHAGVKNSHAYSFSEGKGIQLTFGKNKETMGFEESGNGFSFVNATMDVTPITSKIINRK